MLILSKICVSFHPNLMMAYYEQDQGTGQQIPDALQVSR